MSLPPRGNVCKNIECSIRDAALQEMKQVFWPLLHYRFPDRDPVYVFDIFTIMKHLWCFEGE
mgnify:CR=1 FL=1